MSSRARILLAGGQKGGKGRKKMADKNLCSMAQEAGHRCSQRCQRPVLTTGGADGLVIVSKKRRADVSNIPVADEGSEATAPVGTEVTPQGKTSSSLSRRSILASGSKNKKSPTTMEAASFSTLVTPSLATLRANLDRQLAKLTNFVAENRAASPQLQPQAAPEPASVAVSVVAPASVQAPAHAPAHAPAQAAAPVAATTPKPFICPNLRLQYHECTPQCKILWAEKTPTFHPATSNLKWKDPTKNPDAADIVGERNDASSKRKRSASNTSMQRKNAKQISDIPSGNNSITESASGQQAAPPSFTDAAALQRRTSTTSSPMVAASTSDAVSDATVDTKVNVTIDPAVAKAMEEQRIAQHTSNLKFRYKDMLRTADLLSMEAERCSTQVALCNDEVVADSNRKQADIFAQRAADARTAAVNALSELQTFGIYYDDELDREPESSDVVDLKAIEEGLNARADAHEGDRDEGPKTLQAKLMEHQKIGLAWMVKRETDFTVPRGGLLADEQGLGKTIQCIALTLRNTPQQDGPVRAKFRTLIVAPTSLLKQWKSEFIKHSKIGLDIEIHHGANKTQDPNWLAERDVVITSYGVAQNECPEYEGKREKRAPGPLYQVKWFRIILDESSYIKNPAGRISKAVAKLHGKRRWCLSGTPIQNSIDDIYPVFRFLKFKPYSDQTTFNKTMKRKRNNAAFIQATLGSITLRRKKDTMLDGKRIVELPKRNVNMDYLTFSSEEQDYYRALEERCQVKFSKYLKAGTVVKNYANALVLLLRLRQACNHPLLAKNTRADWDEQRRSNTFVVVDSDDGDDDLISVLPAPEKKKDPATNNCIDRLQPGAKERLLRGDYEMECPICFDTGEPFEKSVTICGHVFCVQCLAGYINTNNGMNDEQEVDCPKCRTKITTATVFPGEKTLPPKKEEEEPEVEFNDASKTKRQQEKMKEEFLDKRIQDTLKVFLNKWPTSRKCTALMELLESRIEEDASQKFLVFSQWTSFLDIIEKCLNTAGIKFRRYDGTLDSNERHQVLTEFRENEDVNVLLCSIKCASMGLNLTCAANVIIVDPWWNPSLKEQAIDRVHRIGQNKDVNVARLVIKGTVEERILDIQERKRALAESALGESSGEKLGRLTVEDLRHLFGL